MAGKFITHSGSKMHSIFIVIGAIQWGPSVQGAAEEAPFAPTVPVITVIPAVIFFCSLTFSLAKTILGMSTSLVL
jgi:hypothetical protein